MDFQDYRQAEANASRQATEQGTARHDPDGSRVWELVVLAAVENLKWVCRLLPYNLSLEVVMAIKAGLGDLPLFPFSPLCSA